MPAYLIYGFAESCSSQGFSDFLFMRAKLPVKCLSAKLPVKCLLIQSMDLQEAVNLTACQLDVVDRETIELHHLSWLRLLILVGAKREGVLADLHQHHVAPLPLAPHRLADHVEVAAGEI